MVAIAFERALLTVLPKTVLLIDRMNLRKKFLAACLLGTAVAGFATSAEAQITTTTNRLKLVNGSNSLLLLPPASGGLDTLSFPLMESGSEFVLTRPTSPQTITGGITINGGLTLGTALTVANGGTGATTHTQNGIMVGAGTGPLTTTANTTASTTKFLTQAADVGGVPQPADWTDGSGNFIVNGTTQQASSNFNISGNGTIGGNGTITGTTNLNGAVNIGNNDADIVAISTSGDFTVASDDFTVSALGAVVADGAITGASLTSSTGDLNLNSATPFLDLADGAELMLRAGPDNMISFKDVGNAMDMSLNGNFHAGDILINNYDNPAATYRYISSATNAAKFATVTVSTDNSVDATDLALAPTSITRSGDIAINPGAANAVTTNGNVTITGKATSAATLGADGATTLTTKGYVDAGVNAAVNGTAGHLAVFTGTHAVGDGNLSGDVSTSGSTVTTIGADKVLSTMIKDDEIIDADIKTTAAIAGTKISPNFGAQAVTTSGNISTTGTGTITSAGLLTASSGASVTGTTTTGKLAGSFSGRHTITNSTTQTISCAAVSSTSSITLTYVDLTGPVDDVQQMMVGTITDNTSFQVLIPEARVGDVIMYTVIN